MQYTHAEKENKRYWSLVLLLVNARYIRNDQSFPIQTSHAIVKYESAYDVANCSTIRRIARISVLRI